MRELVEDAWRTSAEPFAAAFCLAETDIDAEDHPVISEN